MVDAYRLVEGERKYVFATFGTVVLRVTLFLFFEKEAGAALVKTHDKRR